MPRRTSDTKRTDLIISVLDDAFAPLMKADPVGVPAGSTARWRPTRTPSTAGRACLFYADVTAEEDPFVNEQSGRIWIHGDLHVENFGTYLNSDGRMVFDVNDFDEAYLGRFTWDLQRFAASLALVGWQKALPEEDVRRLIGALRPGLPRRRSTSTATPTTTTTSRCTSTTPTARCTTALVRGPAAAPGRAAGREHRPARRHPDVPRGRLDAAALEDRAGQGGPRRSRATSRRSPSTSASTGSCSTTCATSSASRASGSAAPACRRTTCSSRASARRWTTTWCCR